MRVRQIFFVAAFALLWSCNLLAQWKEDGKPFADSSWSKSEGDFGAMLLLTANPEKLFADWETESPGVLIQTAELTRQGDLLAGVVVFTGCAPTDKGFCNVTVTYTLFKPDGTSYAEPLETEVWVGKPPPPEKRLQLGLGSFCVVIEPHDPLGRYKMRAEVRDHVAGRTFHLEQHFDTVAPPR